MNPRRLSWIAAACGGRLVGEDRDVDAVATDSRSLPGGAALFVALKGERFDGHDHVQAAADAGCAAALVSREVPVALAQVVVADSERALASLAGAVQRGRHEKVLAVTGSNGKTTVKTLLLSILQQAGKAHANPGNFNNEIGLPLAVLGAPDHADFGIFEMGAGKPGDIAYLCNIARPDVALVNNVAAAHLERMGSLEGVADTKGAIYEALGPDGVAVINADDAFADRFTRRVHGQRVLRFALSGPADVTATLVEAGPDTSRFRLHAPQGEVAVTLALPGRHNIGNALAAAAMALAAGATLEHVRLGLEAARPVAGRLLRRALAGGGVLIDDSYNANPASLAAAIDLLATSAGEAWLVLGDMRELGEDAAALHFQAGSRASAAGIARLYTMGELSAHAGRGFAGPARHFSTHEALSSALLADIGAAGKAPTVLVKGSRGSAMDRVVRAVGDGGGAP